MGMQLWRYTTLQGPTMRRFQRTCDLFYTISEKHVLSSIEKIRRNGTAAQKETLLELFHDKGCDEKTFTIMALDMLFAGRIININSLGAQLKH
jgi:hypothetical protein